MKRNGLSISFVILFSILFFSCKKEKDSHLITSQNSTRIKYCYVPSDALVGAKYLDKKFLLSIENIKTNQKIANDTSGMVFIKGGVFDMGGDIPENSKEMPLTALPQPDEFPKHQVQLNDFYMDEHEVTVGQYLEFVKATGYKTVAEYDVNWEELKKQLPAGTPKPSDAMLKAGAMLFQYAPKHTPKDNLSNWWSYVQGANWKNPDGMNPELKSILNYPVTQVAWYDAMAYAKWANKRLPTEAEYEYAMRAGINNSMYPWGNDVLHNTANKGNFLQGEFPYTNTGADGFKGLAPVKSFPANAYGLYDIAGNVWEWTLDWYGADYYKQLKSTNTVSVNPNGPKKTKEIYNLHATNKVVRGGSFLCHDNWCSGYRNARRMRLSPDSGMQHLGFRCVRNFTE